MKKFTLIALVLAALGFGLFTFYEGQSSNVATTTNESDTQATEEQQDFNLNPPTQEEQDSGNNVKEELDNEKKPVQEAENESSESGKKSVSVTLAYAEDRGSSIAVSGFANSSSSGNCTLTLSGPNAKSYTTTTQAVFEVNKYDCSFDVSQTKLSKGTWKAQIQYESTKEIGVSNEFDFEIS